MGMYFRRPNRESNERGSLAESKFLGAMRELGSGNPYWFKGVRSASEQEDRDGIDAIALLDVGEIPVQIKSSVHGMQIELKHHGSAHCVVVVTCHMDTGEIQAKAVDHLYKWRGRVLRTINPQLMLAKSKKSKRRRR